MDESPAFGELLRRRRVDAGLTQEELAEHAGISVRTVSDLERGLNQTPRKDTLQLLARALPLSPQERTELEALARRVRRARPLAGAPVNPVPADSRRTADGSINATPLVTPGRPGRDAPFHADGQDRQTEEGEAVPGLRITLLGGFRVQVGSRAIADEAWRLRKAAGLVKLLALAPQHRLPRERIMDLLWPDLDPRAAANSLHQVLHAARRILDPAAPLAARYLHVQGDMLVLSGQHPVWIDVEAFEAAAAEARRVRDPATYQAALELYAGDLLPDDPYEDWAAARREELRQERLRLLLDVARLHEERAEHTAAIDALRTALAVDAALEEAHAGLMRLYALSGQRRQALRQYQAVEDALRRELDVEPHPDTRRLHRAIAAGHPIPSTGRPPGERPPAGASIEQPDTHSASRADELTPPTNLPVQVNSFIGRVREQAEVKRLLATTHVLTLIGAGGSGKTRLAVQVGYDLRTGFADGVWLVELAALGQPGLVAQEVAAALGIPERPGQPLVQTLAAYLQPRRLLLLLDNCEHLIAASATLAEALVRACPHLRILATSREPLHIPGEVTWQVRSLSLPDPQRLPALDDVARYEAVQLFADRARAIDTTFAITSDNARVVAQICYRLDGLPLAIELAAARVTALSIGQIAARLDDCFRLLTGGARTALSRQQTLKAALDWSYDLLTPPEQALFRRLSVFAGSFALDAAEAIGAGKEIDALDVLDLLTSLVDKSLVLAEEHGAATRYRLLEPVRQYARRGLEAAEEVAAVRRRHYDWYLGIAAQANAGLWTAEQGMWLEILELDGDNVRAALDWCAKSDGQAEAGLTLAGALWQFWLLRGYLTEGRRWFDRLLSAVPAGAAPRAPALLQASALAARHGDLVAAADLAEQGRSAYDALQDPRGWAQATYIQGMVAWIQFDYGRAETLFEDGLTRAGAAGLDADHALFRHALGVVAWSQGDYRRARSLMEESLHAVRALGDEPHIASAFLNLGLMTGHESDDAPVALVLEETLMLLRDLGAAAVAGYMLANLGNLARLEGDNERSRRLLEESLSLFQAQEDNAGVAQVAGQLGNLAVAAGDYGRARILLDRSLALRRAMGDRRGIGRTLVSLGNLALAEGEYAQARALYDESMALFQEMGDRPGSAWLLVNMGHLALCQGDDDRARTLYADLFTQFEHIGHARRGLALSRYHLGITAQVQGDHESARACFEASLAVCREVGDRRSSAMLQQRLAYIALETEDAALAHAYLLESLVTYWDLGATRGVVMALAALAGVAAARAEPERAARLAGAAAALRDAGAEPAGLGQPSTIERLLALARRTLGEERYAAAWSAGQALSREQAVAEAVTNPQESPE